MKVLIAEDDTLIRKGLVEILSEEGYQTVEASNGKAALELFAREHPDFVCLDIMMPDVSGYDVCRKIRASDESIPVIFITAKSDELDKVLGLELGADDYITKPFGVKEVVARIRAITRRCNRKAKSDSKPDTFAIGPLTVNRRELTADGQGRSVELSLRQVRILELFSENQGKVLDRDVIMNECWGVDYLPSSRTLDQHISQLRKRIELDPKDPKIITTVHGTGYRYPG